MLKIKTIALIFLLNTLTFASDITKKEPTFLKKGNITIEINGEIEVQDHFRNFPLDLEGKFISRHVLIESKEQMKDAIVEHLTTPFNKVIIECIYRRHCEIEKDIDFLVKLSNNPKLVPDNDMYFKKYNGEVINIKSSKLIEKPEIFMKDIKYEDILNIEETTKSIVDFKQMKQQWTFQELERKFDVLTNMYIDKFFFTDLLNHKKIITDKFIPRYMATLVGSNYCKVDFSQNNEVIMDKKCDINIYNYANRENLNILFVNTYLIGEIKSKEEKDGKIFYTISSNIKDSEKYFQTYDKQYSQEDLNIYQHVLDMLFDGKSYNKYEFNEIENESFKKIRDLRLKKFIKGKNINNFNELEKEMMNLDNNNL